VEFVVVDDGSTDGTVANLVSALPRLLKEPCIDIRLERLGERRGNYHARNHGAALARGDVLVMTDAHVRFSPGWDEVAQRRLRRDRIVCGVTAQPDGDFRGYGLSLSLPDMGTVWNDGPARRGSAVQVAPCHATMMPRELFHSFGGYDEGMLHYGAGGTEFSVRAWTFGAEIHCAPEFEVEHQFKSRDEFAAFIYGIRRLWIHNCVRFAKLYLDEAGCDGVVGHYAAAFPDETGDALALLDDWAAAERRRWLERGQRRAFDWFAGHFALPLPAAA
jgi:glycosyltransferase involved in cell wall biosynthesis